MRLAWYYVYSVLTFIPWSIACVFVTAGSKFAEIIEDHHTKLAVWADFHDARLVKDLSRRLREARAQLREAEELSEGWYRMYQETRSDTDEDL